MTICDTPKGGAQKGEEMGRGAYYQHRNDHRRKRGRKCSGKSTGRERGTEGENSGGTLGKGSTAVSRIS